MKELLKWILLSSIIIILCVSCGKKPNGYNEWLGYPPWYQWHEIDRDTSHNTVVYEVFDDGNCGELGFCPPPEGYK